MRSLAPTAVALALALVAATPVAAANGTLSFATFTTQPGGAFYWQNDIALAGGNGQGGSIFTTPTPAPQAPNAIPILFSWFGAGLVNINATMIFQGVAVNSPASVSGIQITQGNIDNGSFQVFALGQVLLSGQFSGATIYGNVGGTTATMLGNSLTGTLTYQSFFAPAAVPAGPYFFTLLKSGIAPGLAVLPGQALSDFDPVVNGSFGSFVPEPGIWAMLLAGVQSRPAS